MTEEIKLQIKEFILSDIVDITIPLVRLSLLSDYFESLGYEQIDYDSNGWQVDYWITFKNNDDLEIIVSGGLWDYSDITITKQEQHL